MYLAHLNNAKLWEERLPHRQHNSAIAQSQAENRNEIVQWLFLNVSVLHQDEGGIGKSIPDAQKIDNSLLYFLISPLREKVNSNIVGVNFFTMW